MFLCMITVCMKYTSAMQCILASGNDPTDDSRRKRKIVLISIVQGMLYSAVVSLLLASVQCILKVPDHTTRRSERTGSLHECVDRLS